MWQPVKSINTNLAQFHIFFGCPHMNLQLVLFHILSLEAQCERKKLLSSVLSLWGYHCCRVLLSAGFRRLLSLHFSPFVTLSLSHFPFHSLHEPGFTSMHLFCYLSLSLSLLLCPPMCASVVQSVYIHWPCPHYRHNTAAAGCLSHSRHCLFLTRPTLTHLTKWGGER